MKWIAARPIRWARFRIEEVAAVDNHIGDRAVVLGASMAGLMAARVLADAYKQVTVVDRDTLTGARGPRRGAPQGAHAHGLLAGGHQTMEELFPGLTKELAEESAVPLGDLVGDIRWYFSGHRVASGHYGLACVSITRPVLEAHIRARVQAIPNITVIENCDILGIESSPDRSRITGARVQRRAEGSAEELLSADLVVDATGRGSRTPVWLEQLGYPRPVEEKVKVGIAYTTRYYHLKRDVFQGDLSINPVGTPDSPRGAIFSRINENDPLHAELSLTGMLGDHPPTDPEGFLEYAKSLPAPEIYEAIHDAEPLTDAVMFRFPASVRRRYEHLRSFPERLIVLGDAVCSFNPVYGQGMTVAALEALNLREHLKRGFPQPRKYFKAIAKVINVAWDIAAGGDLAHPDVEGKRTLKIKFGNWYNEKVIGAAMVDATITDLFFRVACFVEPPTAMFRPSTLRKVFFPQPTPVPTALPAPAAVQRDEPGSDSAQRPAA